MSINTFTRDLKYPAIDGLRFCGALLVFLVHFVDSLSVPVFGVAPALGGTATQQALFFFKDGHHGVDMFFIISGFLITRMILGGHAIHYRTFVARRILRIYPAFLVALTGAIIFWTRRSVAPLRGWSVLGNLLFLNAVPSLGIVPYLWVSWSLGYEFLFYLTAPVFIAITTRSRFIGTMMASLACLVVFALGAPRMLGLVAGALVGAAHDNDLRAIADRMPLALVLGIYSAVVACHGSTQLDYRLFYSILLPTLSAIFIKTVFDDNWLHRVMKSRPCRFLGTISYSFYLWHILVITTVMSIAVAHMNLQSTVWPIATLALFSLSFGASIAVATVSYQLLEAPYFRIRQPQEPSRAGRGTASSCEKVD